MNLSRNTILITGGASGIGLVFFCFKPSPKLPKRSLSLVLASRKKGRLASREEMNGLFLMLNKG
jgi:short-subunit dehydrogenase involved in D-alanine esterification of teichoic acids